MSKIVLRQFVLASALFVLFELLQSYHSFAAHPSFADRAGGLGIALLLGVPRYILYSLTIATGVALALQPIAPGAFRQGFTLAAAVTLILVANDIALRGFWREMDARAMGESAASWPNRFDDSTSALGGAVAHLLGRVHPEDIQKWPPTPDTTGRFATIIDGRVIVRMSAAVKYSEAMLLLMPFALAGLVLGFATWLHRAATFRNIRDERLLRLALGWLLTLVVVYGVGFRATSVYDLSSPRASMGWLFVPYVVIAIPALLGWRAVRRLDHLGGA